MFLVLLAVFLQLQLGGACSVVAAGKQATEDGSVMVGHTDDAGGGASDLRLIKVPAANHKPGSKRAIYKFNGGYPRVVTNDRGPGYKPVGAEKLTKPLGHIDQVSSTYGYFDLDYGLQNEAQLTIAETTCNAKTVGWPSDLPYGYNMFGIEELTKVALERCATARCAIKLIGSLAEEHGFYSADSGSPESPVYRDSAESLAIADKDEVWIFHLLTGVDHRGAIWAAQRVKDSHYAVMANSFVIRVMDLSDTSNYLASAGVETIAKAQGWWDGKSDFDFYAAYGYSSPASKVGDEPAEQQFYIGRRVWRAFSLLSPSVRLDPAVGSVPRPAPGVQPYPFSLPPDAPLRVADITRVFRDYYQNTSMDLTKGVAAGPFGNPVRFDGSTHGLDGFWERSISIYRTAFSFVAQARAWLPDAVGARFFFAYSNAAGAVYMPFYASQTTAPDSFTHVLQSEFSPKAAYWAFSFVNNWVQLRYNAMHPLRVSLATKLESTGMQGLFLAEQEYTHLVERGEVEQARAQLQRFANTHANAVVEAWWSLANSLISRYSDGYLTTGEGDSQQQQLGYPKWWLQLTNFVTPADTPSSYTSDQVGKDGEHGKDSSTNQQKHFPGTAELLATRSALPAPPATTPGTSWLLPVSLLLNCVLLAVMFLLPGLQSHSWVPMSWWDRTCRTRKAKDERSPLLYRSFTD